MRHYVSRFRDTVSRGCSHRTGVFSLFERGCHRSGSPVRPGTPKRGKAACPPEVCEKFLRRRSPWVAVSDGDKQPHPRTGREPETGRARCLMDRDAEIELLREALRRRAEETSVRKVAAEVNMSHGGIFNIINGDVVPQGKTLAKLRSWYVEQSARGGFGLTVDAARFLVEQMLGGVPSYLRSHASAELLNRLDEVYRSFDVPTPAWVAKLRSQLEE